MGLDRAPIEFQTFYFSHVGVTPPKLVKLAMDANNHFDYDDGDDRDINEAEDDDLGQDPNLLKRLDMFGRLTASSAGGWWPHINKNNKIGRKTIFF